MIALAWEGDWYVTQRFGANPDLYNAFGLAGHEGLDVGMPTGTRVRSVGALTVVEVGLNTGHPYGYYVKARAESGEEWVWAHLLAYDLPKPGSVRMAGEAVGWSGSSGRSSGPHLHIGYRPRWWDRGGPFDGYSDPVPTIGVEFDNSDIFRALVP
jgi:murein DD-endopeptidase MepM/ murein hydrolase activator NlpD